LQGQPNKKALVKIANVRLACRAEVGTANNAPVRLPYQPPASSTFLSQETSHQQPASSTFLSEQISINHQPPVKRTCCNNVEDRQGSLYLGVSFI
jgi:hypothetical protein